ncbi:uncharacterized protein MELLADRAFT_66669 [Melampsora larici-populina 98AG31]|uniref:Uncharacterized protein n=1 Tax=Melampsora larici-populina (strain 98AG31 / pathotype 3-4-7) TaxID=747676 RepID=F4S055_MELLP|nr:uncharacterized protein MELLADRAFT_66669 [Melampsora larici-populina 98AG31]EGG01902.1 hypothetical protein MELLADRAFT_66669 [Melampsora larici-populina 98AG31]
MDFLRLLKPRALNQLPTNQEVPKPKKEVPKVAKVAREPLRLCIMEYADGHLIASKFKVFDEYKRTEYVGRFFLDKNQNMVIEIKNSDETRVELHLRKLATGDCTFVADHQAGVSVTLSLGNARFDRWTLRLREHKYTVTASNVGPIAILWADSDKSMIARLHSQLESVVSLVELYQTYIYPHCSVPSSGTTDNILISVWKATISSADRVNANNLRRQSIAVSSADRVNSNNVLQQSIAISSADRVNSNNLRRQSIAIYSVNRNDTTITSSSRSRMLSPEPILEEPTDWENCDPGPSNHQRCYHHIETDAK